MNSEEITTILLDIRKITNELAKQTELNKIALEKHIDNKTAINDLSARITEVEKQVLQLTGAKKTLIAFGAVISLLIAFFTFYSEHLYDKPSPVEQQKSLDFLWQKYNDLTDKLIKGLESGR